jgi:hypothetical protein
MGYAQAMARLRRAITKVAATGIAPVAIVRELFGDVAQKSAFDSRCRAATWMRSE